MQSWCMNLPQVRFGQGSSWEKWEKKKTIYFEKKEEENEEVINAISTKWWRSN